MALMPDEWEVKRRDNQKRHEANLLLLEKKEFFLEHANATKEDLLGIIFDHKKRLEKLENKLNYLSSRSQML